MPDMNDIRLEKHENWTINLPVWKIEFPISLDPPVKISSIPGFDLPVEVEYTVVSVTVLGKADAQKVAKRLRALFREQNSERIDAKSD